MSASINTGTGQTYYAINGVANAGVMWTGADGSHCSALVTDPDVAAWLETHTPEAAPAPSLAAQAEAMLAAGFEMQSTGTPALDGTYPCDANSQGAIQAQITSILLNDTFTNGQAAIAWYDLSGTAHSFDIAHFKAFATAVGIFVTALQEIVLSGSGALPSLPATIA